MYPDLSKWNRIKATIRLISRIPRRKVFCISMQRSGTTSVGRFLADHGYAVAPFTPFSVEWSRHWHAGDFEAIFRSPGFRLHNAFEDNPWWFPNFYRVVCQRIPTARFILLYRDSDEWFNSMLNHPKIPRLSHSESHSRIYHRLEAFYRRSDIGMVEDPDRAALDLPAWRSHYTKIYEEHNRDAIGFFSGTYPERLIHCHLHDPQKWQKLGQFLAIDVAPDYNSHQNASTKTMSQEGVCV